jgi:hypothetical protein
MQRLLAVLLGSIILLTSCSLASKTQTEIERPWLKNYANTIEADGTEFVIPLKGGDQVEIEVSNATGITTLKDPFGNVLMQSATKLQYYQEPNAMAELGRMLSGHSSTPIPIIPPRTVSTQEYPWRFAFIAASSGNYVLETSGIIIAEPNTSSKYKPAHIKVTFNP